jgi:hypothetical protein
MISVSPARPFYPPPSHHLKKGAGERLTGILNDFEDLDEEDRAEERWLLCKFCHQRITSEDKAIEINNRHCHTYNNPAGARFRIGCFSSATGCRPQSAPTEEYTWFKGFGWQVALCTNCLTQMGWYYQSAAASFYGLILDHLIISGSTQRGRR